MERQVPEVFPETISPEELALGEIRAKNRQLIQLRWIFAAFIFIILSISHLSGGPGPGSWATLFLVVFLPLVGNGLFLWWSSHPAMRNGDEYRKWFNLASLQLDFDLVVLSIVVYVSGNVKSPIWIIFVFHIVLAAFFLSYNKALRNTLAIIFLVTLFLFLDEGIVLSNIQLARLLSFNAVMLFAFFLSHGAARHVFRNEAVFQELLEKTREYSVTDGLTRLFNQTHFFLMLTRNLEESREKGRPFSLIILDVDNFKNYNDGNGHIKGSLALQKMGSLMKSVFRKSDILAKYGGDEFVVILPGTDKVGAYLAAERLRERVEGAKFKGGEGQPMGRITISLGVSSFPEHGESEDQVLDRADRALYFSKESGRNRTTIYTKELDEVDLDEY